MDFMDIIKTRRTVRRFKQEPISREILLELIDAGRCAPTGGNGQPLQFIVIDEEEQKDKIFDQLAWAGHVQPKCNPPADKRPTAYIVVLLDSTKMTQVADVAAATENILLAAWSKGIASCWLGSINRKNLRSILDVPDTYYVHYVIALGYPDETPVMEPCKTDDTKYYLDAGDVLHVPKCPLETITHINKW